MAMHAIFHQKPPVILEQNDHEHRHVQFSQATQVQVTTNLTVQVQATTNLKVSIPTVWHVPLIAESTCKKTVKIGTV